MDDVSQKLILSRLTGIRQRVQQIEDRFSAGDLEQDDIRTLGQELSRNNQILEKASSFEETAEALDSARSLLEDPEMAEMASAEVEELEQRLEIEESALLGFLRPVDPHAGEPVYLEIRAGTGGDEAALFAADLYRMYLRHAEEKNWQCEELSRNETGLNGFKEVVCRLTGNTAWEDLKYESGVHRVQRIPATESGGRIHTSACTVALMPETKNVAIEIKTEDIKFDVYRASGPGGQGVNTTDSAVRITHLPTGVIVTCQTERSQIKNKETALKVLASRLAMKAEEDSAAKHSEMRRLQVGSGDRSERIRTYNFPQNRMTDHRIGLTLYKLDQIMEGSIGEMLKELAAADARDALGAILSVDNKGGSDVDDPQSA